MLNRRVSISIGLLIGAFVVPFGTMADEGTGKDRKLRIGIYDSRAIAIAFAASEFNPVAEKMAAHDKAKAAGDKEKVKELEAWGEKHQRQLHFQGFGRVPVDDLLKPVKDQVARIAADQHLAAVTMGCDFTSDAVELVDITDDLVKLFKPTDRTLDHIRMIRKEKPIPLVELDKAPSKT
jgi:hypothetical protein